MNNPRIIEVEWCNNHNCPLIKCSNEGYECWEFAHHTIKVTPLEDIRQIIEKLNSKDLEVATRAYFGRSAINGLINYLLKQLLEKEE